MTTSADPTSVARRSATSSVASACGLSSRFSRAAVIASASSSMPTDRLAPSRLAAIARTPDPVPTSSTVLPADIQPLQRIDAQARRGMVPGAEAHGWLNDDDESSIVARRRLGPAGTSHGGATTMFPTRTARRLACDRAAQFSSGTSIDSIVASGNSILSAAAARSRSLGLVKNTRQSSAERSSTADAS